MICCLCIVVESIFNAFNSESLGCSVGNHTAVNACILIGGDVGIVKGFIKVVGIICCGSNHLKLIYKAFCVFGNKDNVTHFNTEVFIGVNKVCYVAIALTTCKLCCCFAANSYCGNLCNDHCMVLIICCCNAVCDNKCFNVFVTFTVCDEAVAAAVCEEGIYCACFNSLGNNLLGVVHTECYCVTVKVVVTVGFSLCGVFLAVFVGISCLLVEFFIAAGKVNFAYNTCRGSLYTGNTNIARNVVTVGKACSVELKIIEHCLGSNVLIHVTHVVNVLHLGGLECVTLNCALFCNNLHKVGCFGELCFCVVVCNEYIVTACNTACYCGVCNLTLVVKVEGAFVACSELFSKCCGKLIRLIVYVVFILIVVNLVDVALYLIA